MKTSRLLLTLSLAANAALAAAFFLRAPASDSAGQAATFHASSPAGATDKMSDALRAALASGDVAALQAAGVPADVARQIALGRAFEKFAARMKAAQGSASADGKWWGSRAGARNREEMALARRELSDAMIAAFGDDLGIGGANNGQLAFLPAAKRDALRKILQDYDEMLAKFGSDGVQLASDREKQKMLRAERDRDIAALLTPEEYAAYEMRTSPTAAALRSRYGDAIESEDDFKKIYALQKAFDDKFPPLSGRITPDMMSARADAARQLQDDLRTALGDDKYAALKHASDTDVRTLDSLASRLSLPASTTDSVVSARDNYAAESQRINADTSLTPQQRRAQIQDLGARARADVTQTLGAEGADAYAQRSGWLNMLQNGMAFSTTPPANGPGALALAGAGAPSVYPVMPAGMNPGGARQMIVNGVTTTSDSGGGGGPGGLFFAPAGGGGAPSGNVQVMSFTASSTEGPSSATSTTTTAGGTPAQPPAALPPKQ